VLQDDEVLVVQELVPENHCAQRYTSVNDWATSQVREKNIAQGSIVYFSSYCVINKKKKVQRWEAVVPGPHSPKNQPFWCVLA
jgi:hypothetical protein